MRASVDAQLPASSVMTPMRLVPPFSNSCAAALSSTPVKRKANAAIVIVAGPLAAGDEQAPRVGDDDAHRNAGLRERGVRFQRHQRVALRERAPALDPVGFARNAARRLRIEPERELVAVLDERGDRKSTRLN